MAKFFRKNAILEDPYCWLALSSSALGGVIYFSVLKGESYARGGAKGLIIGLIIFTIGSIIATLWSIDDNLQKIADKMTKEKEEGKDNIQKIADVIMGKE